LLAERVIEAIPYDWDQGGTHGSYVYGRFRSSVEQINNSTGTVEYLHHDQQGSTRLLTGSTGKTEGSYSYGAYGTPEHSGTATTPLGYDAQYTSTDTGLIYLRNRTYDPSTAQFLTVDPVVAVTEAPYTYAEDSPVNREDRSGLGSEGEICIGPICDTLPSPPSLPQAGKELWEGAEWFGKGVAEGAVESYEAANEGAEGVITWAEGEESACQPRNTGDQDALIKIAKRAKRTVVSSEEAEILQEWAEEFDVPFRGPRRIPVVGLDRCRTFVWDQSTTYRSGNACRDLLMLRLVL
jgi:RHS repeat-associated protein